MICHKRIQSLLVEEERYVAAGVYQVWGWECRSRKMRSREKYKRVKGGREEERGEREIEFLLLLIVLFFFSSLLFFSSLVGEREKKKKKQGGKRKRGLLKRGGDEDEVTGERNTGVDAEGEGRSRGVQSTEYYWEGKRTNERELTKESRRE